MLLSTYHAIVNFLYLMVIFMMHLSYVLIRNPCDFRVFEYRSYHIIEDSIHPYKVFGSRWYSTFTPFSTHAFFFCLGFTLHMMPTNSPSIFNRIHLSSRMLVLRYAPGKSKISTFIPSRASMMSLIKKSSN